MWWGLTAATGTLDYTKTPNTYVKMHSAVAFETIPQQTANMELLVQNKTRNGQFNKKVQAYPGDILEYKYKLINPKINGVYEDWKNIQITNRVAENILESTPGTFGNYRLDYNVNSDTELPLERGGEFKVRDNADPGTYSDLTSTATGKMGDSATNVTATSNNIEIEVLSIPEVNFTQNIKNNTYSEGNIDNQETIDAMPGDEIVLTALLGLSENSKDYEFPQKDSYSITLPSVLLENIQSVRKYGTKIDYSIDPQTSTLNIKNIKLASAGNSKTEIILKVGEITHAFDADITATYNAEDGFVLEEQSLKISFIPKDGVSFEVEDLDFGRQVISTKNENYARVNNNEPLVRIREPIRFEQNTFTKVAVEYKSIINGTSIQRENGSELEEILKSEFSYDDNQRMYTWNPKELSLSVPAGRALIGPHTTEMTWTLQNTPGNE